jgi:hypothetical protein
MMKVTNTKGFLNKWKNPGFTIKSNHKVNGGVLC